MLFVAKRTFDLFISLVGLALVGPVFLVVWLLVKLDDGGPVFYRQERVGRLGRLFRIIKFRTMSVGAETAGPSITATGDRRITRIGRLLRKTKIDELPQLWNVLRGEMSFVGPRPEVPKYVMLYTPEQREVLALRPGITDEASVEFRNEEELLAAAADPESFYVTQCLPRKIALNLAYARRANVFRDLFVILRTVRLVWLRP
jgi:lipopolysaccharide/colanic/teichoic acid biosynthesis glycosyltransferase